MQKQTPRRTTTHPNSHDEDKDGEGGRSGYPSDLQTTLEKLHVGSSEDRDKAEQWRQYISTNAPKHNSVKNTNLNTT